MVVVVTNECNMAAYSPEAGNLNGSNADMCCDAAGPSSSGSGDLFELSDRPNETIILLFPPLLALLTAILDLSVTKTPIMPSGRVTSSCRRSIDRGKTKTNAIKLANHKEHKQARYAIKLRRK